MEIEDREERLAELAGGCGDESQRRYGGEGEHNAGRDWLCGAQLREAKRYWIRQRAERGRAVHSSDAREHRGGMRGEREERSDRFRRVANERRGKRFVPDGELHQDLRGSFWHGACAKQSAEGVLELGTHRRAGDSEQPGIHGPAGASCGEGPRNVKFYPLV